MSKLTIKTYAFTLDCKEPKELAAFYAKMLQWDVVYSDEHFAVIGPGGVQQGAYPGIMFQQNEQYQPPFWPEEPEMQQQMAHMDFAVNDLEGAVEYAMQCGASVAKEQFSTDWRVMIDPEGHPFCLCNMKDLVESEHFALL